MTSPLSHPSIERLRAFSAGEIDLASVSQIENHLGSCPDCCSLLESLPEQDAFVCGLRLAAGARSAHDPLAATGIFPSPGETVAAVATAVDIPGYEILSELGRGGMGVVYKARHIGLNRLVALKMILAGAHASLDDRVRFKSEAEVLARLQHPNIIGIYEIGDHGGMPFIALEYVEGGSLEAGIAGQPQPAAASAALVEQIARGIHAAHQNGIVHRDLKPANILIADSRTSTSSFILHPSSFLPKISDFGLAKWLDRDGRLTQTGAVAGTPGYMAPEQAAGGSHLIGPAADVWSLGAILYEMLTGRPPFKGATPMETLTQVCTSEPEPPSRIQPKVPRDLETICLKCLNKEPQRRYDSAAALADDLHRFREGQPISARPVGELEKLWKWTRRRPAVAGLLLAVVVSVLAGSGASLYFGLTAQRRATDAETQRNNATRSEGEANLARRDAELAAARLRFEAALAECEAGAVDRGLFTMLDAWRSAPWSADEFRRTIRANFAAWARQLPVLRYAVTSIPNSESGGIVARFIGPDGKTFVVSGDLATRAQIYETATGKPVGPPLIFPKGERVEAIASDGTWLATRIGTRMSNQRELPSGRIVAGHPHPLAADGKEEPESILGFSRSGGVLAWQAQDPSVVGHRRRLHSRGSTKTLSFRLGFDESYEMLVDRDGKDVVAVFRGAGRKNSSRAEFWDVARARRVESLRLPVGHSLSRLDWDGRTLLSIGGDESWHVATARGPVVDGAVRWWDTSTGGMLGEPWRPRKQTFFSTLSQDGLVVASHGVDHRGRLYDLATGLQRGGDIPLAAGVGIHSGYRIAISGDGSDVLTCAGDGSVRLWRMSAAGLQHSAAANPRPRSEYPDRLPFDKAAFSPDARTVLLAAHRMSSEAGLLLDTVSGQLHARPVRLTNPRHLAFSPDGRLVAACHDPEGRRLLIAVYDAATGLPRSPLRINPKCVHGLTFSPDNRTLAVAGVGGTFLWDVALDRPHALLDADVFAYAPLYRADGKRLAVAGKTGFTRAGGGVGLWDPTTKQRIGAWVRLECPGETIRLSFAQGGRTLRVFNTHDGTLRALDAQTGQRIGKPLPIGVAEQAAFDADGSRLAVGHSSGVRQYDAATAEPLGMLLNSPSNVSILRFSPDGRILAAAWQDGMVRLWDTTTNLPLGPALVHRHCIVDLTFSPDSRAIHTVTGSGTTAVWPLLAPFSDDPDRAELWLQAIGGVQRIGSEPVLLSPAEWAKKKDLLANQADTEDHAGWHAARVRDAADSGDIRGIFWHLKRLENLRPMDWRVYARHGQALADTGDCSGAEAAYKQAAVRAPRSALLDEYRLRGARQFANEKWKEALWYLNRVEAGGGADDWQFYAHRAFVHGKLGNGVQREVDQALAVQKGADLGFLVRLAEEVAARGQWKQSAGFFGLASRRGRLPLETIHRFALALLKTGDSAAYRELCSSVIRQVLQAKVLRLEDANGMAWLCCLGPGAIDDYRRPLALIQNAVTKVPAGKRHPVLNTLGILLYRAGRYKEAIARLKEGIADNQGKETLEDQLFLALAHHRLGQSTEAKAWTEKTRTAKAGGDSAFSWNVIETGLFRREVQEAMKKP